MKKTSLVLFAMTVSFMNLNTSFASNKEVLKTIFDNGTAPADPETFPRRDFKTKEYLDHPMVTCSVIDGQDEIWGYDLSRKVRVIAAHGPLLPGSSEEKLFFGNDLRAYSIIGQPEVQDLDLVISNPMYKTRFDVASGGEIPIPAKIYIRESGNYIGFKININNKSKFFRNEEYYGYCYPKGLALF